MDLAGSVFAIGCNAYSGFGSPCLQNAMSIIQDLATHACKNKEYSGIGNPCLQNAKGIKDLVQHACKHTQEDHVKTHRRTPPNKR